ncbi:MAG TPA: DUF805 domain-containing protein [Candidatus Krumholzibacteria bacterium]|nr:DUF805 domain-containing protein [Candidatus Krumholzibacteria bacterium]
MANLFSMRGRISRREYMVASLANSVVSYVFVAAIGWISATSDSGFRDATLLGIVIFVASTLVQGFYSVRRLHDLGRPSHDVFLLLVPFYNIYFSLILCFTRGTSDKNERGPAPA